MGKRILGAVHFIFVFFKPADKGRVSWTRVIRGPIVIIHVDALHPGPNYNFDTIFLIGEITYGVGFRKNYTFF